jgi:SAM-dependent methyltransferase
VPNEPEYVKVNRLAYDCLADQYLLRAREPSGFSESPDYLVDQTLRALGETDADCRILEVGPGVGSILAAFEKRGYRTFGVELSARMAQHASELSPRSHIAVADIMDLNFPPGHFTVVYLGAVIHLFPVDVAHELLGRVRQWLKPGGILFVNTTVHDFINSGFIKKSDYRGDVQRYRTEWTEQAMQAALGQAGLELVSRLETREEDRQKHWVAYLCRDGDARGQGYGSSTTVLPAGRRLVVSEGARQHDISLC